MNTMDKIMDMICAELEEIAERGQLSAGDLETLHKLIVTKEKLLRIEEIEENLGYSQDTGISADGSYSRSNGNSYSNRGRHYVRGHYSYGRGRNRYSMAEGNEMLLKTMQEMMVDPMMSEADRNVLRRAIDVVSK